MAEKDIQLQSEGIIFIQRVYEDESLPVEIEHIIYKFLECQTIENHNPEVRKEAVHFWMKVTRKIFTYHGCVDCSFPAVLFSKRIVMMTKKEIRFRIYKILTDLCQNGCLRIFKHLHGNMERHGEAWKMVEMFFKRIYSILVKYEITPDTFLISHQAPNHIFTPRCATSSDEIIREMFDDAALTIPADLQDICTDEDLLSVFDNQSQFQFRSSSEQKSKSLTPSEFIAFVYSIMASGTEETNNGACQNRSLNTNDLYNIIDY